MEDSLLHRMMELGWRHNLLSKQSDVARIKSNKGYAGPFYEPFSKFQRIFNYKTLPLKKVIPINSEVIFLSSLKYDVYPPLSTVTHFLLSHILRIKSSQLKKLESEPPFIQGLEVFPNPAPNMWKFDSPLRVIEILSDRVLLLDDSGEEWQLPLWQFTYIKQTLVRFDGGAR